MRNPLAPADLSTTSTNLKALNPDASTMVTYKNY
jgi:hypothetical protein